MKRLIAIVTVMTIAAAAISAEAGDTERFALIAGSNTGGKATATLRYAASDAKKMRDVLVEIGGLKEENSMLLLNPEKEGVANGLSYISQKIARARSSGAQVQFVFYYSGHSDERGLLLSGEYFDYRELKTALDALGADVSVVILDSCSSGAFTREKGGSMTLPFLLDDSTAVEGHAYFTSSTAEEASQESDRIESSFFTYNLVGGLRGAADLDGDGKVDLNEAYHYAYNQTLRDTEKTRSGAQHPAYDIKLEGKGDLVLTDLRAGEAVIKIPKNLIGRFSLRDVSDKLVVEVAKTEAKDLFIGVPQGYYRVLLEEGRELSETVVIVDEPKEYELRRDVFHGIAATVNRPRGPGLPRLTILPLGIGLGTEEGFSLYLGLLGGKAPAFNGLMSNLLYSQTSGASSGYQGALFADIARADFAGVQGPSIVNVTMGDYFGVQFGGAFNEVGGNLMGMQLGPYNHVSGNVKVGQLGAVNIVDGEGFFFQAGAFNLSGKAILGVQLGLVNAGNEVDGVQFPALLNIAKKINGLQVGLINYSEEQTGVQIGLINISKRLNGLPIGIIDIQYNGENHIDFVAETAARAFDSLDNSLFTTTYFRFGSKYFYKYFGLGIHALQGLEGETFPAYAAGLGLGFRIPFIFEGFAFHIDGGVNYQSQISRVDFVQDPEFFHKIVPQFRVFASMKILGNAGLVAGLDQWVYTKNFHAIPAGAGSFTVITDLGNLVVDSKFFVGLQL